MATSFDALGTVDPNLTDGGFVDGDNYGGTAASSTPQGISTNQSSGSPSLDSIQSLMASYKSKIGYSDGNPFVYHPAYMLFIDAPHLGKDGRFQGYLPETFDSSLTANYGQPFGGGSDDKMATAAKLLGFGNSLQIQSLKVWQGSEPVSFTIPVQLSLKSNSETDVLSPLRTLLKLVAPQSRNGGALSIDANGALRNSTAILTSPGPKVILGGSNGGSSNVNDVSQRFTADAKNALQALGSYASSVVGAGTALSNQSGAQGGQTILNGILGGVSPDAINGWANGLTAGSQLFSAVQIINNISMWVGSFEYYPSIVITSIGRTYEIKLDRYSGKPIALEVTISCDTLVTPKSEDIDTMIPQA